MYLIALYNVIIKLYEILNVLKQKHCDFDVNINNSLFYYLTDGVR